MAPTLDDFPPFDLGRLLKTVFAPKGGEKVAILIDLKNPKEIKNFSFLENSEYTIQRHAYEKFYQTLHDGLAKELGLEGGEMFAYEMTYGSNLDLQDLAVTPEGEEVSLEKDVYPNYDLILCISTYSATAPLTAFAKQYGFRGATLHGLNDIILGSGLAVDYNEVSAKAEKMRVGMSKADAIELEFEIKGRKEVLRLELGKQEAQKSHGLCLGGPDIANLPAGEVYYVPTDVKGSFPFKYEDGTIAILSVEGLTISSGELLEGNQKTIDEHMEKIKADKAVGEIGELGFGTQVLPVSGRDIQDEKILGTFHVATGRSDHLGGNITPDRFKDPKNATHDDILYSPEKTPEVTGSQVRLYRDDQVEVLIENFAPSAFLNSLITA